MKFDPDVEYSLISGQEKASILLSTLGASISQSVFKHLKDNDAKRLINSMANIKKSPIWVVRKILEEFHSIVSEERELIFSRNKGRDFVLETLGEKRANQLLGQIVELNGESSLESLELVDPRTLSNFLINEHPQTIALIVAHLPAEKKIEVVRKLPEAIQAEVILRIANLDFVSPDLVSQLDDILKTELSTLGSMDSYQLGGVKPVVDMLNMMDKNNEKNVMSQVEEKDPDLAEEIWKLMFVFEDLVYIDDKGIQNLLKDIDYQKLVVSLKIAPASVKEKLLKNMSQRAGELLIDDLEALPPKKLSEVEKAQFEIINKCKELESLGKLIINRGGDGDRLV